MWEDTNIPNIVFSFQTYFFALIPIRICITNTQILVLLIMVKPLTFIKPIYFPVPGHYVYKGLREDENQLQADMTDNPIDDALRETPPYLSQEPSEVDKKDFRDHPERKYSIYNTKISNETLQELVEKLGLNENDTNAEYADDNEEESETTSNNATEVIATLLPVSKTASEYASEYASEMESKMDSKPTPEIGLENSSEAASESTTVYTNSYAHFDEVEKSVELSDAINDPATRSTIRDPYAPDETEAPVVDIDVDRPDESGGKRVKKVVIPISGLDLISLLSKLKTENRNYSLQIVTT